MKQLECMVDGCEATITAATEDEVMEQAAAHGAEAHPDLEVDEELAASLRTAITDV
ncbi:MAG: DUF1059 domain-containing protein [Halobacteriales archaeon]|nr:DUF1059 domain-containing protein [Halobacteriales archaeon]